MVSIQKMFFGKKYKCDYFILKENLTFLTKAFMVEVANGKKSALGD